MTKQEIRTRLDKIDDMLFDLKMGYWSPDISIRFTQLLSEKRLLLKKLEEIHS